MGVNKTVTDEQIIAAVETADSMSMLLRTLGFRQTSGRSSIAMRKRLVEMGITKPELFRVNRGSTKGTKRLTLEEICVENSTYKRYQMIKKRLIARGLKTDECEVCGQGNIWNGKPVTLQLDHINGINNDNRIENLRIICPMCHTQTDTFGRGTRAPLNRTCECGASKVADAMVCWGCYIKTREKK